MQTELIADSNTLQDYFLSSQGSELVLDTESTGLRRHDELLIISAFSPDVDIPVSIVLKNNIFKVGIRIEELIEVFNHYKIHEKKLLFHNAKYDLCVLRNKGFTFNSFFRDTSLMIHCYDPARRKNLELRVKEDFKVDKKTFAEICGKKWESIKWDKDPNRLFTLEQLCQYAAEDAKWTYSLYEKYDQLLTKDNLYGVYQDIEHPLVMTLVNMYERGVKIDIPFMRKLDVTMTPIVEQARQEIFNQAGCVFNINSPDQKAEVLFDRLHLPTTKQTKTGKRSTDASVLEDLADSGYSIANTMLRYAEIEKLQSTYVKPLPTLLDSDGRLRCSFNATGAVTGRFSSSDPNLQNIVNSDEFPVRAGFVADKGNSLVCLDYSQIEPRLMAHLSQDKKMLEIFLNKGDIYQGIADDLKIERKAAKVVQLAISYGIGIVKLAARLGLTKNETKSLLKNYYQVYAGFARWKEHVERNAVRNLYTKTMFGRIRRFPELRFPNIEGPYHAALRQAVNAVVQGSAADMMKMVMPKVSEMLKDKFGASLLLTVHDELLSECPSRFAEDVLREKKLIMENTVKLSIPVIAEGKICSNWGQMKDKNYEGLHNITDKQDDLWQLMLLLQN